MTRPFVPIAIVGQACLLPGANSADELWSAVLEGRVLLRDVPPDRWGLDPRRVAGSPDDARDRTWSERGGYVEGFAERFDPSGFALEGVEKLDPLVQWLLHCGREALSSAGDPARERAGAIIGNLSFPSEAMARYAERVWLGDELADAADLPQIDPRSRFMSGLPAHLLAQGLGLGGESFCLDAACASSLVAVKLACDKLADREADVMLAGAVSRADDLFIHIGFCALQAMSRSGQSRPFHPDADGLVPAEGAGMLVLMRLDDAAAQGRPVLGVIRGAGMSNDGRGQGLLAPSSAGQARALRAAYEGSGLSPADVDYVECHATGTPTGDGTELATLREVFADHELSIGSLKANLGHLITAAGVAGIIKVCAALRAGMLPPTPSLEDGSIVDGSLRVLHAPEPWPARERPRRAAISAFGFGGNNAHIVVEAWTGKMPEVEAADPSMGVIAVVALADAVLDEGDEVVLPLKGLRFPPRDLEHALPQQLLALALAQRAVAAVPDVARERTGVFFGMGCDPTIARYGARWRLPEWARRWGVSERAWVERAADGFLPSLEAAGVLGTMPNIVANRIHSGLDLGGFGAAVSSEEISGLRALQLAVRALREEELDAVVVGAVDFSRDAVHERALEALGGATRARDGGAAMVVMRLSDAKRAGLPILALVDPTDEVLAADPEPVGAHAAEGLLRMVSMIREGRSGRLEMEALGGQRASVRLKVDAAVPQTDAEVDGPVLRFAPHAPPVTLPPWPADTRPRPVVPLMPPNAPQAMAPAPSLEPVTPHEDRPVTAPTPESSPGASAPAIGGGEAAAPVAMVAAPVGVTPAILAHQRRALAAQHQAFLQGQQQAHQRFLEAQTRAQRVFADAFQARGPRAAAMRPVSPMAPPVAPAVSPASSAGASPLVAPPAEAPSTAGKQAPIPSRDASTLPGPKLDRDELLIHSGGNISEIFGPQFAEQDSYERQVRMPLPPLLLADRMTGLAAEPCSMGTGTIWTETDVADDAWYMHRGRMPAGLMIESGQADLMLISYLGIDLINKSERIYRLLGCELTYHASLPAPGETLQYEIHLDGHAQQGDVRLFFFHYDCVVNGEPRLTVRGGQAGFFTDQELAESAGVLWDAETGEHREDARMDPPPRVSEHRAFTDAQLRAFAEGRVRDCFGPGFDKTCAHTDTPTIASGRMRFIDEVTHFEPEGGPWGRGYLRAVDTITPDDWFFEGHFKNDPCMPGTLMFEGCLQTMAVYLTALGFTIERDGWRFEPVPEEPYKMRCRGQVTPTSRELIYEVFIEEVVDGDTPMIFADLLCTVDGLKAFHCRRMGLRLVPDWPLERILKERPELLSTAEGDVAEVDGFPFDHHSLLACAWGRPTEAFGPIYAPFDSHRTVARLPGPPYHFMTRIASIDGAMGSMESGQTIVAEYDVPDDAWYFDDNGARTMPFCVLLEAALQPCGWLASFVGSALSADIDLAFRNLDGTGNLLVDVLPDAGTLRTRTTIKAVSSSGGMIIEAFDVECFVGDQKVYEMDTVFGFFPKAALESQAGLAIPASEEGVLEASCDEAVDLAPRPARYFDGGACLPSESLMMIERVTGIWRDGGDAGLGRYRSELDVDPDHWFLKAHFFTDPVQPGSLGIEAMVQLLQFAMLEQGMDEGIENARFEPIGLGMPCTWKYRGQVRVHNRRVHCVVDVTEQGEDEYGRYAIARASLYCDGMRIYEASNLGMRIVSGGVPPKRKGEVLDPEKDRWLEDHCPTYTVPALPLMSMVDRLAAAALVGQPKGARVVALEDVQVERWLPLPGPVEMKTAVEDDDGGLLVTLLAWREAARAELSRFEPVASGRVVVADAYAEPPPAFGAVTGPSVGDPYANGELFHGPAFQKLKTLVRNGYGASATLDATPGEVPCGALNQVLLDAATHAIPHADLHRWTEAIGPELVAYPYRIPRMTLHRVVPTQGEIRCEVRFAGMVEARLPKFDVQLIAGDDVWCTFELVEIALPKGPLGAVPSSDRLAFLRDRRFVPGMRLSTEADGVTMLSPAEVKASNWLPGTLQALFRHDDDASLVEAIAAKEHVAARVEAHPANVSLVEGGAIPASQPIHRWPLSIEKGDTVRVRSGEPTVDLALVRRYWDAYFAPMLPPGETRWPVEDLYYGLIERFVRRIHVVDPDAFATVQGKSILYLANHQTAVESLLFSIAVSGLSKTPTVTLAKIEHRHTWLGKLIQHCFSYPGIVDPNVITYFDRDDPMSLQDIIGELVREMSTVGKSVMVHVEGTRSFSCRTPVVKMTSKFIDMALATRAHIVPVRFVGGLPGDVPLEQRTEFPVNMGRQDIYLGRPIPPETFEALPYKERKPIVIDAINALGPDHAVEEPFTGDEELARRVEARVERTGASPEHATLFEVLVDRAAERADDTHPLLRDLLEGAGAGQFDDSPRGRWLAELARRLHGERG